MATAGWRIVALVMLGAGWAAPVAAAAVPAATTPALSQPPITLTVKHIPAQRAPRIGEPVVFDVRLEAFGPAAAGSPEYGQKIGPWEVLAVEPGRWQGAGPGPLRRQDKLTLTTYEPGEVEFPSLVFKFKFSDGKPGEFRSAAFKVKVDPLPAKPGDQPGQLRGLKAPIGMLPLWLVLATALLLAGAAYLIWRFEHSRRAAAGANALASPPRPAEEVAQERLAALKASAWLAQAAMKPYYSELADILRRYLEARLRIPASDRTTLELMRELKATVLKRPDLLEVREVLDASDMVKFAKAKPSPQEAETHWQMVADLVARTTAASAMPAEPAGQAGGAV